ncbi:Uncharacterised protein [Mycobacteroides abscessus subsp. abscessus]|nr:Uncharacterised protein [Mycobacteroides abscessus subsp. abscessus]
MRWAGWWLGPLLGGIGAYAVYVLPSLSSSPEAPTH